MRIAIFVSQFPVLSETFVVNSALELLRQGHDVHVFVREKPTEGLGYHDDAGVLLDGRVHYVANGCSSFWGQITSWLKYVLSNVLSRPDVFCRSVLRLFDYSSLSLVSTYQGFEMLKKGRFDVIHAQFLDQGFSALEARVCQPGVPIVVTMHGFDVNNRSTRRRAIRMSKLFASDAWYTSNTQFTKKVAVGLGCDPDRIEVVPAPVVFDDINFISRSWDGERVVRLLAVGRLVEKKGFVYLLEALVYVANLFSVKLDIAGGGPLEGFLKDKVNALGLSEIVCFHGWSSREKVLSLYNECHVFILPSVTAENGDKEGQGIVLQEAQAAGIPVISTLHNGIPDGLLNGVSGVLVPEKESSALSDAIIDLISRSEDWVWMGEAGSRFVRSKYGVSSVTCDMVEVFRRSIDGDNRG